MYSGTGIYSLPEASRLVQVPSRTIRRWLFGHKAIRQSGDEKVYVDSPPLWLPEVSKDTCESEVIGFHDLLEVRFVNAFVQYGVPLQVVRRCLTTARHLISSDYPFSSGDFKTDGRTIFATALLEATQELPPIDLKTKQFAFKDIISQSLYAGIEYDGKTAKKWYPQTHEKQRQIVLDPSRQFGAPILDSIGIPTGVLFASYVAEGKTPQAIIQTARAFDINSKLVEAAVRFEENLTRTIH